MSDNREPDMYLPNGLNHCVWPMKFISVPDGWARGMYWIIAAIGLLFTMASFDAAAQRTFERRFPPSSAEPLTLNGDIVLIGNTALTCPSSNADCVSAQSGGNFRNNDFTMEAVDVDSDATTTNSSAAQLTVPAGSTIRFAGLYWAGTSAAADRTTVLFDTPASANYLSITAANTDVLTTGGLARYQSFADVTAQVSAAGAGVYTVANVSASTGIDRWAGWTLVVVYSNPASGLRNVSVFDGFQLGNDANPQTDISISGFLTPTAGPVNSNVGIVVYDGDRGRLDSGSGAPSLEFGPNAAGLSAVSDSINPIDDVWNSSISFEGANVTAGRNPAFTNTLGVDIDNFRPPTSLPNGSNAALLRIRAQSSDVNLPGIVTIATDAFEPNIVANFTKVATDGNGAPFSPGDEIIYTIALSNTGNETAQSVVVNDPLPAGVTYVPGSIVVTNGPNSGPKTDASGDDQAFYNASNRTLTFNLGTGAAAAAGGTITPVPAADSATEVQFRVIIDANTADGASVSNVASISYVGATTGTPATGTTDPSTFTVSNQADLAITKTLSGLNPAPPASVVTYQIVASNNGPQNVTGAVITDTVPAQLLNVSWTCTPTGTAICSAASGTGNVNLTGDIAAGAGNQLTITVNGTAPSTGIIAANTATIQAPTGVTETNAANNSAIVPAIPVINIDAVDDPATPIGSTGGQTPSVLLNDTALGAPAQIGINVSLTPGTAPAPTTGSITMNPDGTITVAPGTTPGTYQYPYTICLLSPNETVCDTALAEVVVTATPTPIDAVNDGPLSSTPAGGTTPSVVGNDRVNGQPVVIGTNASLTPGTSPNPGLTMNPDGTITIAPGTPPGTYQYPYEICVLPATTPPTCDTAIATVVINPAIDAVNDAPSTLPNTGGTTAPVTQNDTAGGAPAVIGSNVTLTPGAAPTPPAGSITMNPNGTITVAPGTTPGTYSYPYEICLLPATTPPTCDTATATVIVAAGPVIDAINDAMTTVPGTGGTVPSVINNDLANGVPVVLTGAGANATLTPGTSPNPGLVMNLDGTITVAAGTPAGSYSYPYQICLLAPNQTVCDTAVAIITVAPSPIVDAVDDPLPAQTPAGGTTPSVIGNDTTGGVPAVIGTNVSLTPGASPNPGLTMNPDGTITVAPGTTPGTYNYPYTICLLPATTPPTCDTATAVVTVTGGAPVAQPDRFDTPANTPVSGSVLGNDTGLEDGPVTVTLQTPPSPDTGTVVVNPDGTFTFTPAPGFTGPANFTYEVCDASGDCDTATVTIVVGPVDEVPVAVNDRFETPINTPVSGNLAANDSGTGDGPLTFTAVTQPANGTLVLNPDGTFTFTPTPGFVGETTFIYEVCDADGDCSAATVTIVIAPDDDTPVAVDDRFETPINTPVSGNIGSNDTGTTDRPLTFTLQTPPTSGTAVVNPDGTYTFTPAPGFTGTVTFDYEVCDADNDCDIGTVTIVVTPDNDAPVAVDDDYVTPVGVPVSGNLTINDTNLTDLPLSYAVITQPDRGTLILNPDGTFTYIPEDGDTLPVTFVYRVCDADGDCAEATATIIFAAPPPPPPADQPIAVDDTYTAPEGSPITGNLGDNDTFGNGNNTFTLVPGTGPANGTLVLNPDGTFTYTPNPGFSGIDTFDYEICDEDGDCSIATATLTVTPTANRVSITKSVTPNEVRPGALLAYTLTIRNLGTAPVDALEVIDTPADGLAFVVGSSTVVDTDNAMSVTGSKPIRFGAVDVPGGGIATIRYLIRVGAGLPPGQYTNQAVAQQLGVAVSNTASATVVRAAEGTDPVFEQSRIWGKVFDDQDGDGWQDEGELGIPGVRLATVEGLLIETDAQGRYNIEGIVLSNQTRGQNFIVKLDPSTIPPGAELTTENPLLRRLTPGLPTRFDFGVKLPPPPPSAGRVDLEFGEALFESGSASIKPEHQPLIDKMADAVNTHQRSEIVLTADKAPGKLALQRAEGVRDAVLAKVGQGKADSVTFRINAPDGETAIAVDGGYRFGDVFFDTDKSVIKPEYRELIAAVAQRIASAEYPVTITVTGFADVRGTPDYNKALSMRRSRAVTDAISALLSEDKRMRLRVTTDEASTEVQP